MAIGDYGNGNSNNSNGNNKLYENTYYSRLRAKTSDGKTALGYSFRSGLLIISIAEQKDGFRYEDLEAIHLSPTKATILANQLKSFKSEMEAGNLVPGKAYGVNAGMGEKVTYIAAHIDEDNNILITIGKFDSNGQIIEKATTHFNKEYHYGLEWNNIESMDLSKAYYDNLELDQLITLAEDFGRSMSGAYAYSHADLTRYDNARILGKMDPIYDKLGIERRSSGNGGGNRGTNNFLNNAGTSSNHTTLDDIME